MLDRSVSVSWIDGHSLTQQCFINAFTKTDPSITVIPFESAEACIKQPPRNMDVILYYLHEQAEASLSTIAILHQEFEDTPIIVMFDEQECGHPTGLRDCWRHGARGLLSTRSTTIATAIAAIHFVRAGGTFAPPEAVFAGETKVAVQKSHDGPAAQLTNRQAAVLFQLRQGKRNKNIAKELGMSQSTVKVHMRTIFRKLGVTNRAEAAFRAGQLP